jgi:hypothetical protein
MNLSWFSTLEWLKFAGLTLAGLTVAVVLLALIFAAVRMDLDDDIEQ